MVLRKSFYIGWSAGRSPRVHEVNPGRDPSGSSDLQRLEVHQPPLGREGGVDDMRGI